MFDTHPDQRMALDALRAVVDTQNTLIIADAIGAVAFLTSNEETNGVIKPLIEVWIEILRGKPFTNGDAAKIRRVLRDLESRLKFTA